MAPIQDQLDVNETLLCLTLNNVHSCMTGRIILILVALLYLHILGLNSKPVRTEIWKMASKT